MSPFRPPAGNGTVKTVTSADGSVIIIDPNGPSTDLSVAVDVSKYLPLAGGTMTGPIIGFEDKGGQVFNVKAYGAKVDGITRTDGASTASSATFTSATGTFTSADVGKSISIASAGGMNATLSTALVSGTAYTSLSVTALTAAIASGAGVTLVSGADTQTFIASAAVAIGATAVPVYSLAANFAYPIGTYVNPLPLNTTISAVGSTTSVTLAASATSTTSSDIYTYGTDDTTAWDSAIAAAVVNGGKVYQPQGISLVSAQLMVTLPTGMGILFEGAGVDASELMVIGGSFTTQGILFNLGGAATFGFDKLTIDLNGQNQNWAASGSSNYYKAISGDQNNGGTNNASLFVGTIRFKNASMTPSNPLGIGIDTFGLSTWNIGIIESESCDTTLFITQAFSTTPNQGSFGSIMAHNNTGPVVEDEGGNAGPGWSGDLIYSYSDALVSEGILADGMVTGVAVATSGVQLGRLVTINGRYPLSIHNGLSNSSIATAYAKNCRGSYNIQEADGTCSFGILMADGCAIGSVLGATVYASLECGNVAGDAPTINNYVCNNSQNQAIQGFGGPVRILGGRIKNGNVTVSINTPIGSLLANIEGYNPAGAQTAPTVPASGTPLTNPFPFPCTVYVNGGTMTGVAIGGTATGDSLGGAYRVPAGQSITLTYSAAPTWQWFGD